MAGVIGTAEELNFAKQLIEGIKGTGPVIPRVCYETVRQGWGALQKGRAISGSPLRLNGTVYNDGLGTHAESVIVVKTNLPVRRFIAMAGVDDNGMTRNHVNEIVFAVEAGGKELWRSKVQKVADDPAKADVDLGGVREFTLKAWEINNVAHLSHANWGAAKVILADGREVPLGTGSGIETIPPFSFRYGGEESWKLFSDWPKKYEKVSDTGGVTVHRIVYRDPKTGLECAAELKEFSKFPAAEWVLRFKNTGKKDTPILENIQALDLAWPQIVTAQLHYSLGSNCRVDDFLYKRQALSASPTRLTSGGGRSSDTTLPFFNLAGPNQGMVIGLGWTGQWAAEFSAGDDGLKARVGMEKTHLVLHPGEEIRTPSVAVVFWNGTEPLRGNNLLRQFILAHHTYRPDGKTIPTPITAAHWGGMKSHHHLARIAEIKKHKLDYDYYWIDAGWYGPADSYSPDEFTGDWAAHVGNWNVNPAAHPNGLRPISDAARDAGMKFLLWFEPERAIFGTPLTVEHPEWFLGDKKPGTTALFNLGIPEARKWLINFIDGLIKEHGVGCYRQDFNMAPLDFWRANDAPDRQGMTEIRHIEGLYEFWDELLRRNPGLIIDNCSSGGRRIDLETTGRSIPLWRSDVQCWPNFDPNAGQVHTCGLVHWVPCSTTGNQMRPGDTYNFRSAICTGIQFSMFAYERNAIDPNYPYDWHRKMLADQRRAIPFFLGDYYPLLECSTSDQDWMVYQMHRADLEAGFVLAFRREHSPFLIGDFRLRGLTEKAVYQFEDADTGKVQELGTDKIAAEGFRITIDEPRQSRMFFYKKK